MERKLTAPPSKKGAKVWIAIVVLMLVVSAFSGAVSAENVSEELGESVTDGGSLTRLEEATNQSAPLGTVSSNLGEQAASLAEAVVSAPYLWGGKGYKWNPSTGGWSGGEFVDSTVIKTGYYFYNPNTGTVTWGIGLDCSGLSFWAFNKAAGATKLIDSSNPVYYEGASGQWNDNTRFEQLSTTIPTVNDLNAGYLLFLDTPDGGFGSPDHVGMYVGNGYVIHSKGGVGVEKKTLNDWLNIPLAGGKKYSDYFFGYGRVKATSGPKFNIGDTVRVTSWVNVRTGPGTGNDEITDPDYPGFAPEGTLGTVLNGPSSADGYIWWEVNYGPGLYSGWSVEDYLEKVEDTIFPTVDAFSVTPDSVTRGDYFTISYTVSDTGGSGLKLVDLWRGIDVNGEPDWGDYPVDNPKQTTTLSGQSSYSGSFSDAPPSVGTYWYGIHVVDNADNENDEQNSQTGGFPDDFGPIDVEVTSDCDGTDTSCGVWPNCENCNGNDGCWEYSNGCEIRDYYCYNNEVGCLYTYTNRHADYYDSYVYYCSGDTVRKHRLYHDFYCDGGTCIDHPRWVDDQLVENCNDYDGWYCNGDIREYRNYYCSGSSCTYTVTSSENCNNEDDWYDTGSSYSCCDGDEVCTCQDQEYRNYYCSGTSCTYQVTSTQTVKSNCVTCSDGDQCTADSCSNGACSYAPYCSGTDTNCGCTVCENCNSNDNWYDTGMTKWITITEYECAIDQKEQKEQEYRDYSCSGGSCTPSITSMQWVDTGNTQTVNKLDGTDCGSDGWYDTGETKWVTVAEYECTIDQKEQKKQEYRDFSCSAGSCTPSVTSTQWVDTGNTQTVNKPDGTDCGCTVNNTLKKCYDGSCFDSGICNSTICGADATCDGKKPGETCGIDSKCVLDCKCMKIEPYPHTDVGVTVDVEVANSTDIEPYLLPGTNLSNVIVIRVNATDTTPENTADDAYTDITINVGALNVATCQVFKEGFGFLDEVDDVTTLPTVKPPGEAKFARDVANNTVIVRLYVGDPLLAVVPQVSKEEVFDTGKGTYPSISGTHNGTITPFSDLYVTKLYTYPCPGTGGHAEYVLISNESWSIETLPWKGYSEDWQNLSFDAPFTLYANETYNYTIRTGSYPQIHHNRTLLTENGWINCTEFEDINGKRHECWIPAVKLWSA